CFSPCWRRRFRPHGTHVRTDAMQILLIEDDPRVAAFVTKSLREEGHVVEHCADGRAGLAQATAERYDTIVLDRMLPQLDGMGVLEALRGTGDTTPVLILSAL